MKWLPRLPEKPTLEDIEAAARAKIAGDPEPMRRLYRRSFWWGFTHPFG